MSSQTGQGPTEKTETLVIRSGEPMGSVSGDDPKTARRGAEPEDSGEDSDQDRETAHIQHEIEQTRAEMSQTIDVLQDRLDPERLSEQAKETAIEVTEQAKDKAIEVTQLAIEQAKDAVREMAEDAKRAMRAATIGKVENMVSTTKENASGLRSSIMDTVRENPIPAALVGIGLGWLFMNGSSSSSGSGSSSRTSRDRRSYGDYGDRGGYDPRHSEYGAQTRYGAYGYGGSGMASGAGGAGGSASGNWNDREGGAGGAVDRVKDVAGGMAGSVAGAAGQAKDTVQDAAGSAAGTVQDLAGRATDAAGDLADQVQYQASRVEDRFQGMLHRNPLAIGAVALGLGAAIGLALPGTRQEDELMGDMRENVMDRAQDVARDATEKVKSVAGEAKRAATDEAREQHLTK
ncbi:MAG TPA: DUF3618 domain-containing protein [Chloroflexota bacterium]|nr:DUF3618 domain-containing protein [Chloroflexota bacterium]